MTAGVMNLAQMSASLRSFLFTGSEPCSRGDLDCQLASRTGSRRVSQDHEAKVIGGPLPLHHDSARIAQVDGPPPAARSKRSMGPGACTASSSMAATRAASRRPALRGFEPRCPVIAGGDQRFAPGPAANGKPISARGRIGRTVIAEYEAASNGALKGAEPAAAVPERATSQRLART